MKTTAVQVTVSGRVQGVAYRWSTVQAAQTCGVAGWVRNRRDGSVEAHLEGPPDAVQRLLAWMAVGPAMARVEAALPMDAAVEGLEGFEVRPTV